MKRLGSEESDPINIPAGNDLRSFLELTPDWLSHFPEARKAAKLGTYVLFSTEDAEDSKSLFTRNPSQ